jgi:hypothetical protein
MSDNPYTSPSLNNCLANQLVEAPPTLGEVARNTFLVWEKLRLVYVSVLVAVVVFIAVLDSNSFRQHFRVFMQTVLGGAVIANLCYFAGPMVETYVTWLGYRGQWLRIVLFALGTLFSSLLALGLLAGILLPGMD